MDGSPPIALGNWELLYNMMYTADLVLQLATDYDFLINIGFIRADNDVAMHSSVSELSKRLLFLAIDYDAEYNRLRCSGHIINLSVKCFFFDRTQVKGKKFPRSLSDEEERVARLSVAK
jgi:hypothetical protein